MVYHVLNGTSLKVYLPDKAVVSLFLKNDQLRFLKLIGSEVNLIIFSMEPENSRQI